MAAEKGSGFLVKIGDGGSPEVFSTVAGLRSTTLTINNDAVDITNKESGGWRELLAGAGIRRITVAGSGVFTNAASEATIRDKAMTGSIDNYEIIFENADRFSGTFQVVNLDYAGDFNGERTYSLSLESSGSVSFQP